MKTIPAFEAPDVERFYVSRIPWTGPADRYMPEWGYDHLSGGRT